jgi:bifunctional DNase/RNase
MAGRKIRMEVIGLAIDSTNNSPIVLLREVLGERLLPIWIGIIEASAIAFELEKVQVARPLTHDLMLSAMDAMHARLLSATITDLKDSTYIAELRFMGPSGEIVLDSRPSDALALALKAHAPIDCEEEVLERIRGLSDMSEVRAALASADAEKPEAEPVEDEGPKLIATSGPELGHLLETLAERDFGKYKM